MSRGGDIFSKDPNFKKVGEDLRRPYDMPQYKYSGPKWWIKYEDEWLSFNVTNIYRFKDHLFNLV